MALPRDLSQILQKMEPRLRRAVKLAFEKVRAGTNVSGVERLLRVGDAEGATKALDLRREYFEPLERAISEVYLLGGLNTARRIPPVRLPDGGKAVVSFSGQHPRALDWTRNHSGNLITAIVEDQRVMARSVMVSSLQEGANPRTAALDLVGRIDKTIGRRVGGFIGLDKPRADVADKVKRMVLDPRKIRRYFVEDAKTGTWRPRFKTTDRRFDRVVKKAILENKSLSADQAEKLTRSHRARLLRNRAETIARTESITAMRAGKSEGYRQLVDTGAVADKNIKRTWDSSGDGRVRGDHAEMDGQTVYGMEAPFVAPDGSLLLFPGDTSLGASSEQTIQCRCIERVTVDYLA